MAVAHGRLFLRWILIKQLYVYCTTDVWEGGWEYTVLDCYIIISRNFLKLDHQQAIPGKPSQSKRTEFSCPNTQAVYGLVHACSCVHLCAT